MLDKDSRKSLGQRVSRGQMLIASAWGQTWDEMHEGDRESAARDAISDMLTALLGPAGVSILEAEADADGFRGRDRIEYDQERINEASRIASMGVTSYEGDAEDYFNVIEEGAA